MSHNGEPNNEPVFTGNCTFLKVLVKSNKSLKFNSLEHLSCVLITIHTPKVPQKRNSHFEVLFSFTILLLSFLFAFNITFFQRNSCFLTKKMLRKTSRTFKNGVAMLPQSVGTGTINQIFSSCGVQALNYTIGSDSSKIGNDHHAFKASCLDLIVLKFCKSSSNSYRERNPVCMS